MKLLFIALFILLFSVVTALFFTMSRTDATKEYEGCVKAGGVVQKTNLSTCMWPNSLDQVTIEL